jgi:predicted secreted Zn-dependent protease
MGIPGNTKAYLDNILMNSSPILFKNDGTREFGKAGYGKGGLSFDKHYMVVST